MGEGCDWGKGGRKGWGGGLKEGAAVGFGVIMQVRGGGGGGICIA